MAISSLINTMNPQTALWGNHILCPPGRGTDSISGGIWDGKINITHELDIEQQGTTEAQNPLDHKGGDKPRSFSITVQVIKQATGQYPIAVYLDWKKDLGKKAPFFIGATPIDSSKYILEKVSLDYTNSGIGGDGAPFMASIGLSFQEDTIIQKPTQEVEVTDEKTGEKKKTASKAGPSKAAKKAENSVFSDTYTKKEPVTKKGAGDKSNVFK